MAAPCIALARDAPLTYHLAQHALGGLLIVQTLIIVTFVLRERRRRKDSRSTQRTQIESLHAARLALAGEITASIVHEITQPLSAILTNIETAQLLLAQPALNAAAIGEILADVRRDDLRASDLVQRWRALLRKREPRFERVDIGALSQSAAALIRLHAIRRSVAVQLHIEQELPAVEGDPVQLQQVLLNLLLNAMDAMATIPPARRHLDIHVVRALDCAIEVAITDSGVGMSEAQLARTFDSFYTTKETGMGLGLSIARSIVHTHGGAIWAEPVNTGGTTFRFRIPSHDARSAAESLFVAK